MRSKTSKQKLPRASSPKFRPWKAANACSEEQLGEWARELAPALAPGDRVLLEGPMGAGKTTFARALLSALGVAQPPEGSPSFAIAHEYRSPRGEVVHVDFYRIRDESEIADAGVDAYFWERQAIVIAEWTSLWPRTERAVIERSAGTVWRVRLEFGERDAGSSRRVGVERRG